VAFLFIFYVKSISKGRLTLTSKALLSDQGPVLKTLQTRNLQQMARFRSKLVSFLLSVTNILALKYSLAYYGICKLRICSVLKVQAAGWHHFQCSALLVHLMVALKKLPQTITQAKYAAASYKEKSFKALTL
jgi:hypothetical protein